MNQLLLTLLEEFSDKINTSAEGIIREAKFPAVSNKVMVAIGMRRTGKTYFLLQIIKKLLKDHVTFSRILYINFEDNRLSSFTSDTLSELLDSFYSLYPENHDQLCYFFLDEIQNVENWQLVIRRYLDTKKIKIYLTGSSAKLLSKEIATSLRGRAITKEIWPFNFTEYMLAKQISFPKTLGKKNLDKLIFLLKDYINKGGFPEPLECDLERELIKIWSKVLNKSKIGINDEFFSLGGTSLHLIQIVQTIKNSLGMDLNINTILNASTISQLRETIGMSEGDRRAILQGYVDIVIFRDIVERYKITNITLIRYMIKFLLNNIGCSFSVHKFYNDLKSQGFAVAKTTVHDYLSYIEDAYLAFTVPLYSDSLRKIQVNPRKIYAVDSGLTKACTFGFSENFGHAFENLIYLELRRAGHQIYYYLTHTRKEVDFLTQGPTGERYLFQVCWDTKNVKTLTREIVALQEAEKELNIKGECITADSYFTSFLPFLHRG